MIQQSHSWANNSSSKVRGSKVLGPDCLQKLVALALSVPHHSAPATLLASPSNPPARSLLPQTSHCSQFRVLQQACPCMPAVLTHALHPGMFLPFHLHGPGHTSWDLPHWAACLLLPVPTVFYSCTHYRIDHVMSWSVSHLSGSSLLSAEHVEGAQ